MYPSAPPATGPDGVFPTFPAGAIMWIRYLLCGALTLAAGAGRAESDAAAAPVRLGVPGLPPLIKPLRSLYALRFQHVVRQERDYTCGAAALSTILRYVFARNISETEIIDDMLKNTDPEQARKNGFSLLDIKKYVERIGLRGRGYQVDRHSLQTLKIPVIALQKVRGYPHFVVVKRVADGIVYLADPVLGQRQVLLDEFIEAWNGIVFAVVGAGVQAENALLRDAAHPAGAAQRAAIATTVLAPQQDFGLLNLDAF